MTNPHAPVFPTEFDGRCITKRELFAAMAMQGMLSNSNVDVSDEVCAKSAVELADALIAELAKGER